MIDESDPIACHCDLLISGHCNDIRDPCVGPDDESGPISFRCALLQQKTMANQETAPFEQHAIQDSTSSRKRAELRLSERRTTAKDTIQRPPNNLTRNPYAGCVGMLLIGSFLFLMAATMMMTAAMMMGVPTAWPQVRENLTAWIAHRQPRDMVTPASSSDTVSPVNPIIDGRRLVLDDDFSRPTAPLAEMETPDRWLIGFVIDQNVYRMRVWRGFTAWSRLHFDQAAPFRLEADSVVAQETQRGYAGFLTRYYDDANYLLLAVDGEGRFNVMRRQDGVWNALQPWTDSSAILPAGEHNVLALEEDGQDIRFWCNNVLLFAMVAEPNTPLGDVGLIAGSKSSSSSDVAEVNYSWLKLYELIHE